MVRSGLVALVALGATQCLVRGLRPEHNSVWPWREHPASPAEELQKSLSARLAGAEGQEIAEKAVDEAQKQEQKLRELVANIRGSSQSANRCYRQLGGAMANLTQACEGAKPEADWLLDYYDTILPKKTCNESVADIFAAGRALVETLHVSRHAVAALKLDNRTLRRYQALSFLRSWLVNLTRTSHPAMLWAGFWDGDPHDRTTKKKLFEFASETDHATVHPDSILGQIIEAAQDINACYTDQQTNALASNMWAVASMSFVLGMYEKAQGTVVSLVNKELTGERSLSKSVLFAHEIPTVGLAAWGLGFWSPRVVVVDLMGTCDHTSPALQMQLFARLPTWAKSMPHWSRGAFALRSRLQWQCIDCSGACSLDRALAEHVDTLVKAKEEQDRKDRELLQVVAPKAAIKELLVEYGWQDLDLGSELLTRPKPVTRYRELKDRMDALTKNLIGLVRKSLQGIQTDDDRTRKRRVERLLGQKADPSALGRFGNTALSQAAFAGHVDVLETLMKHGNQLEARDQQGCTALIHAARRGHLEVVKALLKAGAQLEAHDNSGSTALLVAATEDHLKVVEALLKAGARPEARGQYNWTLFDLARQPRDPGLADILKKHLEAQ